jgi:hypothetical protein
MRAGSLDALKSAGRDGRVFARHNGVYVNGKLAWPAGSIDRDWWRHARDGDAAADRIVIPLSLIEGTVVEGTAIGVEVEEAALLNLFATPSAPTQKAPRHGGRKPHPDRDVILDHHKALLIDVADQRNAAAKTVKWVESEKKAGRLTGSAPHPDTIRAWYRRDKKASRLKAG